MVAPIMEVKNSGAEPPAAIHVASTRDALMQGFVAWLVYALASRLAQATRWAQVLECAAVYYSTIYYILLTILYTILHTILYTILGTASDDLLAAKQLLRRRASSSRHHREHQWTQQSRRRKPCSIPAPCMPQHGPTVLVIGAKPLLRLVQCQDSARERRISSLPGNVNFGHKLSAC